MNLELFNNLINSVKENNVVQTFVEELKEFIERNSIENSKNIYDESILNKILKEYNITSEYRDKMYIERANILQNYAKKTANEGAMHYVYNKVDEKYLISICDKNKSNEIIELTKNELPNETKIDSVLRLKNGIYVLDGKATDELKGEMLKEFNKLIEEQSKKMKERRIEGHVYEFIEKTGNSIFLIDKKVSNEAFEEFYFDNNIFYKAREGDLFQYTEGKYQRYS